MKGKDAKVVVICRECGSFHIDVVVNKRGKPCCIVCESTKVDIAARPKEGEAA
jgi:hypothetical protein